MSNVIDLQQARDDRGSWFNGWAQCSWCGKTHLSTVPEAYDGLGLDCPFCERPRACVWPVQIPSNPPPSGP